MSGFEARKNNRGNYSCPYCKHKSWKTKSAAENHIQHTHEQEAKLSQQQAEYEEMVRNANNEKWLAESRANKLQKELDATRKPVEKKKEYYNANIYCSTCMIAWNAGMPKGQTFADTPCSGCGNRTLFRVVENRL